MRETFQPLFHFLLSFSFLCKRAQRPQSLPSNAQCNASADTSTSARTVRCDSNTNTRTHTSAHTSELSRCTFNFERYVLLAHMHTTETQLNWMYGKMHTHIHTHLETVEDGWVTLPAKCAQNQAPALRTLRSLHGCLPGCTHACRCHRAKCAEG